MLIWLRQINLHTSITGILNQMRPMKRYDQKNKMKNIDSDIIMHEQEQESQEEYRESPKLDEIRFKSIPSKKVFDEFDEESFDTNNSKRYEEKPLDQIKLTYVASAEKIVLNNYFGSKKTLERKAPLQEQQNPEKRQRRQVEQEDANEKLAKIVQKQIQDRQKWQNQKQQASLNTNNNQSSSGLLVINDKQSYQKIASQLKLKKINEEKFAALNIQKNDLFKSTKGEDSSEYVKAIVKQPKDTVSPLIIQRTKRQVSELKPLKKKPSTYEVLNNFQFLTRNKEGDNFTAINQAPKRPQTGKTLNLKKQRIIALDIKDLVTFNTEGLKKNKFIEGTVKRDKIGVDNTFFPEYRLIFDEVNVIHAKKTMAGYNISTDPEYAQSNKEKLLGTVKGNLLGSYYNIFKGPDQKQIEATIYYGSDGKSSSQFRQLEVYVKDNSVQYLSLDRDNPNDKTSNLKELYLQRQNKAQNKIRKYINKKPIFDQNSKMYKLDFGGKVTVPSVKNVILVNAENPKQSVLVFGKFGQDSFYLKAEHPLSPLMIMGYLMTSFNFKFVTQ